MPDQSAFEETSVPDEAAVRARMAELGLSVEILQEAVRRGHLAGAFVTNSHPRIYRGMVVWCETNGALREQCGILGWSFDDTDNIPRAISPDEKVVVYAVSGNEHTGLRHGYAQTRRPRGDAGVRIVQRNAQLELEGLLSADARAKLAVAVATMGPTWFLLYFEGGDKVRSELSLARGVAEDGGLIEWSERLILPEIDLTDPGMDDSSLPFEVGPDIVVPVTARINQA